MFYLWGENYRLKKHHAPEKLPRESLQAERDKSFKGLPARLGPLWPEGQKNRIPPLPW